MESHGVIRLRLLGSPAIDGPGVDGPAVLKQPKRLLLLAYLAARDDFVTRDTLLGLFWPTLDEDRARRALSQAIHFLRSALGRRAILTRGTTEVSIGPNVTCDVTLFESAIRQEAWEEALRLYDGELLAGVFPPRAVDVGLWLESERSRLLRLATRAATQLSDAAFRNQDLKAAIAWRRRALEISPFDEAAHRDYLALLHDAGDAAGAIAAHEAFRTRLHELYGIEPSADTLRIVNLIRSRQSGTAPDPAAGPEPAMPARQPAPRPQRDTASRPRRPGRGWWLRRALTRSRLRTGALVVVPLLLVLAADRIWDASGDTLPLVHNRVAVLYLDVNGGAEELRYLADGLTEALIGYLGQARHLEVVSANGVRPFRGMSPPLDTVTGRLRAKTIVTGTVARSGGTTRVTFQVTDGEDGSLDRHFKVESTGTDLLQVIDEVTVGAGRDLSPVLGDLVMLGRWRAGTSTPEALDLVLRAAELRKDAEKAAGNAESRARLTYAAADSLLELASSLDPDWLDPHVLRGHLALGEAWFCLDDEECVGDVPVALERAVGHAEAALAINPVDSGALELYGRALLQKWMILVDPDPAWFADAERALAGAVRLDASRSAAHADLSALYFAKADFAAAEAAAEDAMDADAFLDGRAEILMRLFQSAFHRGHDTEAERWCDGIRAQYRGSWMGADCRLNLMAWSEGHEPHPDSAWLEVNRSLLHESPVLAASLRPRLELQVAAVLARAQAPDSAAAVIRRALRAAGDDPVALYFAAGAWAALGEGAEAVRNLQAFLDGAPANRGHVAHFRWFEALAGTYEVPPPERRSPG